MPINKLMKNYGWVQNTSNLVTIRETLMLMPDYGIMHLDLREKIREYRKGKGDLPKLWTWDARCRIKAIHALGFVKLNRNIQGYELTELGKKLKDIKNLGSNELNDDEISLFKNGLLTNPPVIRVLNLFLEDLKKDNVGLSKYDIGAQLGFVGDIGFTHIDPYWVANNQYSFNDKEGDADKWARTIIRWLEQVGWIYHSSNISIAGQNLKLFKTKDVVDKILRYDVNKIKRNVPSEMLCSDHHPFPELIQKRRITILQELSREPKTKLMLLKALQDNEIEANNDIIDFEILNLGYAGFRIVENGGYLKLNDKIYLDYPILKKIEREEDLIEKLIRQNIVDFKNTIPARLIDHLIRFGYDKDKGKNFESIVGEFFRFLGYDITKYGQGKGRVADILARYIDPNIYAKSYALIIDTKATSKKYNFPASDIRKMKEYIKTHGPDLARETITKHAFSFISSEFVSNANERIKEISKEMNVHGCAIRVLSLLVLGDKIRKGKSSIVNLYHNYTTNSIVEF